MPMQPNDRTRVLRKGSRNPSRTRTPRRGDYRRTAPRAEQ